MKRTLLTALLAGRPGAGRRHGAWRRSQGVSKNEILVGSIQDLSGPLAAFGKQCAQGMLLRVEEVNEQGGIHGRKIKLVVEDDGYDPKQAVLAAQKLVNQDKIFIVAGHIGTAQNNAAMPVQFEKNVINFLPVTAAREMYEPFNRLKYSFAVTYYDQMRTCLPKLVKEKGVEEGLRDLPGRRLRPGGAARRRGRPEDDEHGTGREDLVQARLDRLLVAGGANARPRAASWWCWAPSSARPSAPSARRARPASTRSSSAPVGRLHRPDPQARRQGDGRPVRDA